MTHQICDNSKIGSFDLVKNSFAAEPETHRHTDDEHSAHEASVSMSFLHFPTRDEAGEVRLNGFELVDVILPLLVCDFPGVVVAARLSLDLAGGRSRGQGSYRWAFLQETEVNMSLELKLEHIFSY